MRALLVLGVAGALLNAALAAATHAQRQMERLDRGVVAIPQAGGGVFVSWRMFGDDRDDVAFNLYRQAEGGNQQRLNDAPLDKVTWFVDEHASLDKPTSYFVRTVAAGVEDDPARSADGVFTLPAKSRRVPCLEFPISPPLGYRPNDASAGDLDGDGQYDLVIHMAGQGRDNSQNGETTPPWLFAYKLDGTLLWRINVGRNIREGAHYTQFMVFDLDGDGRRHDRRRRQAGRRPRRQPRQPQRPHSRRPRVSHRVRRHDRRRAGNDRLHPAPRRYWALGRSHG